MSDIILSAGCAAEEHAVACRQRRRCGPRRRTAFTTGKQVNSRLRQPINFLTSRVRQQPSSDSNRCRLRSGKGQQTLQAANNGLNSDQSLCKWPRRLPTRRCSRPGHGTTTQHHGSTSHDARQHELRERARDTASIATAGVRPHAGDGASTQPASLLADARYPHLKLGKLCSHHRDVPPMSASTPGQHLHYRRQLMRVINGSVDKPRHEPRLRW